MAMTDQERKNAQHLMKTRDAAQKIAAEKTHGTKAGKSLRKNAIRLANKTNKLANDEFDRGIARKFK